MIEVGDIVRPTINLPIRGKVIRVISDGTVIVKWRDAHYGCVEATQPIEALLIVKKAEKYDLVD